MSRDTTMQEHPKLKARWFATILKEAETLSVDLPWQRRRKLKSSMIQADRATKRQMV